MIYDYDFSLKIIDIPVAITAVDVLDLIRDIRQAEATDTGMYHDQIASASGNEELDAGVAVGITVNLLDDWQIRFAAGAYIAKVSGGNLVGGIEGDPVAYSAEVQVLLIQSAASTTVSVSTGSGLSPEQDAKITAIDNNTTGIPDDVWEKTLESGFSAENMMRLMAAALAGKVSGAGSGTVVFRDIGDVKDRITADVDSTGNRTAITLDET